MVKVCTLLFISAAMVGFGLRAGHMDGFELSEQALAMRTVLLACVQSAAKTTVEERSQAAVECAVRYGEGGAFGALRENATSGESSVSFKRNLEPAGADILDAFAWTALGRFTNSDDEHNDIIASVLPLLHKDILREIVVDSSQAQGQDAQ